MSKPVVIFRLPIQPHLHLFQANLPSNLDLTSVRISSCDLLLLSPLGLGLPAPVKRRRVAGVAPGNSHAVLPRLPNPRAEHRDRQARGGSGVLRVPGLPMVVPWGWTWHGGAVGWLVGHGGSTYEDPRFAMENFQGWMIGRDFKQ